MITNEEYERIYEETQEFTRADFVKRIKELEEINEEHRKLNGKLLDINNKFKNWINSLEESDLQDDFVVVRLSDIKNKLKEVENSNENNNV